ncbi:hypothetical protein [Roseovarius sp. ZX-A-9]|uniref:hypothetical protein n=1 Tax=Roseovarius sp. ZX-A-9 TaxID=3014783 RepID=UPI0023313F37|nr:hypothetical protein [Roseovarius sp. ZX-A-9]
MIAMVAKRGIVSDMETAERPWIVETCRVSFTIRQIYMDFRENRGISIWKQSRLTCAEFMAKRADKEAQAA